MKLNLSLKTLGIRPWWLFTSFIHTHTCILSANIWHVPLPPYSLDIRDYESVKGLGSLIYDAEDSEKMWVSQISVSTFALLHVLLGIATSMLTQW